MIVLRMTTGMREEGLWKDRTTALISMEVMCMTCIHRHIYTGTSDWSVHNILSSSSSVYQD